MLEKPCLISTVTMPYCNTYPISTPSFYHTDIDECAKEIDNCHMDADCSNTDGSFNCTCQDGYKGNGTNCTGMVTIRIPVGHCLYLLFNIYVGSGALPRLLAVVLIM